MVGVKTKKIVLNGYGSYLGMEKGCFKVRDKEGNIERYPLFEREIGEVILKTGSLVSVASLEAMSFWNIDVLIQTQRGRPVAILKSLEGLQSHVSTRLWQYEAWKNSKGIEIAKQIVLSKIEGQNIILEKYGLETHQGNYPLSPHKGSNLTSKNLNYMRRKLISIEAKHTKHYFNQIFELFPKKLKLTSRETFLAYDGMNNTFNLAYEVLSWKVHRALINAKLEPYLGFLHSTQFGKPSLVCDFMELYRYLIDDFLIQYCKKLRKKDFIVKTERLSRSKEGKRQYLNDSKTRDLIKDLNSFFESKIEVPRIRYGFKQTLETLINEEALLFAKYLRGERDTWIPRLAYAM